MNRTIEKRRKEKICLSRGLILMPLLILAFMVVGFAYKAYAATETTEATEATEASEAGSTEKVTEKLTEPDAETINKVTQYMKQAGIDIDETVLRYSINNGIYTVGAVGTGNRQEEIITDEDESLPPSQQKTYRSKDFVIDDYDIHIRVNENNTLDITEKINVWFNVGRHGIYRTIPLENEVERLDGTKSSVRARVSDISVNEEYTSEYQENEIKLQIGNEDEKVKGQKIYEISYTYNLGKDQLEGADELYFNLIGTGWSTVIGRVSFTIDMPKSFDSSKVGFSAGWRRSTNNSDVVFKVDGNRITGEYDKKLLGGQALTVRIELPEGYFVGARLGNLTFDLILYSLPVVFLIISLLLWKRYGKDDTVVDTVEFYPPDDLNSLKIAFFYKGDVASQDVSSLLIYLADKGYLQIEESEEKVAFWKKKSFRIIKLKDYNGGDPEEQKFFDGLFSDAEEVNGETAVTSGQLYNKFYKTTSEIIKDTRSKENIDKLFVTGNARKSLMIGIFTVISAFAIFIPPIFTYSDPAYLGLLFLPIVLYGIMLGMLLYGKGRGYRKGKMRRGSRMHIPGRLAGYLIFLLGILPFFALIPPVCKELFYVIGTLIGACCIVGMIICLVYMPKRTPYGIRMLGRIDGFRNFLVTAEKDRLEEMVMSDPQYFFHILPYTYVLGVSDVWIKKFEDIQLQDPGWCRMTYYDVYSFGSFMDHTMATADRTFTSSPAERSYSSGGSGGGGFSGGGFSGGGSGGGGGGSW